MSRSVKIVKGLRGLMGAAVGGALGYFAFFFMVRQGFYAMVLPGALLGLGCGVLSGFKSNALGLVSGLLALLLGVFTEWRFAPFVVDDSFMYFVSHLRDVQSGTLVLIAIGAFFAFWFGRGRDPGVWRRHHDGRDHPVA